MKHSHLTTVCAVLVAAQLTPAADRPNIILVMADDLGWGDVAYNGNKTVQTPHLDRMAREAVRLDRFYAAAPVCSPTRGSCLTGRHPYRYGITWAGEIPLQGDELTIAETLRVTTLGDLSVGDRIHLEPAVAAGKPLGGHLVQGHIDGVAELVERTVHGESVEFRFQTDPAWLLQMVANDDNGSVV